MTSLMKAFSETYNTEVLWGLTFFKKEKDDLEYKLDIPIQDDAEVRQLLGYKEDELLVGEHPVNQSSAVRISEKYHIECDVLEFDVFLGASAVEN